MEMFGFSLICPNEVLVQTVVMSVQDGHFL